MTITVRLRAVGALSTAALALVPLPILTAAASGQAIPSPAAASARVAATSPTLYVARRGSDHGTGSKAHPLRTVGEALARVPTGGAVVVGSGSYHESLVLDHQPDVTIQAAPRATVWLDGSSRVTNWESQGSTWVRSGWRYRFDHSPTYTPGAPDGTSAGWGFVNPAHPMAAYPDEVWIDGARQRQVGSRAEVGPGEFYVDDAVQQLVIGSDPSGHEVRASTLAGAVAIRSAGVTLDGIGIRRYATSVPGMGTVTVEAPGATLRNLAIRDNATTGLFIGSSQTRVVRVRAVHNGLMGLAANLASDLQIRGSRFNRNNVEQFNAAPSAGGAKLAKSSQIRIRNSQFDGNRASGLWFDVSDYDLRVLGSRFEDNSSHGINLEVSSTAVVADNVIARNGGFGIQVNDTDNVQIWNNTLVGNDRSINIVQDSRDVDPAGTDRSWRPDLPWLNRHVGVYNNVISRPGGNCLVCVEDYTQRFSAADLDIRSDANVYQPAPGTSYRYPVLWGNAAGRPLVFYSIPDLRAATGQERSGRTSSATLLTRDARPTRALRELGHRVALAQPSWLRSMLGHGAVAPSYLGAW